MENLAKKVTESESNKAEQVITIIGTGNYGIAIGKRLLDHGYQIVYGSRRPNQQYLNECFSSVQQERPLYSVSSIVDAWNKSTQIVIFAVSAHDSVYQQLVDQIVDKSSNCHSRVVIEISNLLDSQRISKLDVSNAEKLQKMFDQKLEKSKKTASVNVVKGFNLLSALSISSTFDESLAKAALTSDYNKLVPIAGDDRTAKRAVIDMCANIGYTAHDIGSLSSALKLEIANKRTFSEWYYPSLITLLAFLFNEIYIFVHYFYFPKPEKRSQTWQNYLDESSLLAHTNKVLGFTALQLLAFVYFAYVIASCFQLAYGTKYKKFPALLDFWLRSRKQFGLWAFLIAVVHSLASCVIIDKAYIKDWYLVDSKGNTTILGLNGDLSLLTGMLGLALLTIVALTSINSIGQSLNFGEWTFVQSKLGLACLFVTTVHTVIMYLRIVMEKDEKRWDTLYLVTRIKGVAFWFPVVVLAGRFVLALPPLSGWLEQIRNGTRVREEKIKSSQVKPLLK
jgi:predicted dinucleotide-binding enzyme/DMSO/TMAO reductase YedYZ heme-binding membrane subunit